jgi:hypothetical protein
MDEKEKKCIKFTGYIYLPDETDNWNSLRDYAAKRMGRIIIYDEFNIKPPTKAVAFDTLGQMLNQIEKQIKVRTLKRVKRKSKEEQEITLRALVEYEQNNYYSNSRKWQNTINGLIEELYEIINKK